MATKTAGTSARERILQTAVNLFYRQGYHETGINQIIEESGVSKATFYAHYPSKEDLAIEYIRTRHHTELQWMKDVINESKTPFDKFMAFIRSVGPWLVQTDFRGCEFLNMAAEIINPSNPIRKEIKYHIDSIRSVLRDVAQDLIKSDEKYKHLDAQRLADSYWLIVNGAIATSTEYHELWPFEHAMEQVQNLLK